MKTKEKLLRNPIFWAFLLSFGYWFYLALTSHMVISCDAVGYESLGKALVQKGWPNYFLNGPEREPFFPFLVSISMRIGTAFSFPYQLIQVFMNFFILFITQLMILRILRILSVNSWISSFTILYLGVSPAIVNSALSLYSEIATYPLILAIILLIYQSWIYFPESKSRIVILAIVTGLILVLITLTKGIFEFLAPVFVGLFCLSILCTRNRRYIINCLMFLVIVLTVFYSFIAGYKLINKKFNGNFVITNRGSVMLYGGIARRAEPLTRDRFLTALAHIPGEGVCEAIFGKEKCYFWSIAKTDEFGYAKVSELTARGLQPEEVDKEVVRAALKKILQNPGQSLLLWFMEDLKMVFWESTQIGFVSYPAGLSKLFCWSPLKNGLRLLMAILTFSGLICLVSFLLRERKSIFEPKENVKVILFLIAIFIFLFTSLHALCAILIRYAFPIVPLYLIIIAFFIQRIFTKTKEVRYK